MSPEREQLGDLPSLLAALLDGQLSADDELRLGVVLRDDPQSQQTYLDLCWTHALLRRELGTSVRELGTSARGLGTSVPSEVVGGQWSEPVVSGQWSVASEDPVGAAVELPHQAGVEHSSNPQSLIPNPLLLPLPSPLSPFPSLAADHPFIFSYIVATVIFGFAALVGWLYKVEHYTEFARSFGTMPAAVAQKAPAVEKTVCVARVTGLVDCRWERKGLGIRDWGLENGSGAANPPSTIHHPKSFVRLGDKFALASGLLQLTYDSGAKVILQGPCTYEVDSAAGGFLSLGKLTARIGERGEGRGEREGTKGEGGPRRAEKAANPKSQISKSQISNPQSLIPNPSLSPLPPPPSPFVVKTPTAVITDLGTEFGVEVDESGAVETQVFEGAVQVAMARDGAAGSPRRLVQGEAVRIASADASIEQVALRRERFIRRLPRLNTVGDEFDSLHDYLTEGTAGSPWNGILNARQAARLDTLPVEIDGQQHSGRLVIAVPEGANAGWAEPHRGGVFKNAPYIYVNVSKGDFEAQVRMPALTTTDYSAAGLMARLDGENFVSVNRHQFPDRQYFATRSHRLGEDSDLSGPDAQGQCAVRLVRVGDVFMASYSADDGQTWTPLNWSDGSTVLHRPDMTGPVQVGLWYGTFNPTAGQAAFDDFNVRVSGGRQPDAENPLR